MTTHFNVTWPDGSSVVEAEEAVTADAYALARWGLSTAAEVLAAHNVKIELHEPAVEAAAEDPPAETPAV